MQLVVRKDNVQAIDEIDKPPPPPPSYVFDEDKFKEQMEKSIPDPLPPTAALWTDYGMKCDVQHLKEGFEGQTVYVWNGRYKGKLGVVRQMSSKLARLSVESAIRDDTFLDVATDSLMAYVAYALLL